MQKFCKGDGGGGGGGGGGGDKPGVLKKNLQAASGRHWKTMLNINLVI